MDSINGIKKRIGIFVFYDRDGIVSDYVPYLLDRIVPFFTRFIIVYNGELNEQGQKILFGYTPEVYVRDNEGYDGGAYKYILTDLLKKEELLEYDECVLFNDTFYGPIYDFAEMFNKMESADNDIWGLSMHGKCMINGIEMSEHIQSYFLAIKRHVFLKHEFWDFWADMAKATDFDGAVVNFEIEFSKEMIDAGLKLQTYLFIPEYHSDEAKENYNYSQLMPLEAISKHHFPVYKRKNMIIGCPASNELLTTLDYIDKKTDYPVELIWKDAIRRLNLEDIQTNNSFQCAVSTHSFSNMVKGKLAVFIYVYSNAFLFQLKEYIDRISSFVDVIFFWDKSISSVGQYVPENVTIYQWNGERIWDYICDNPELLLKYDYVGVVTGQDLICDDDAYHKAVAIRVLLNNLIASEGYVKNVINLFEQDETLGICEADCMPNVFWEYAINRDRRTSLHKYEKKISYDLAIGDRYVPVFSSGNMWIRTKVLSKMLDSYDGTSEWVRTILYRLRYLGYHPLIVFNAEMSHSLIGEYKRFFAAKAIEIWEADDRRAQIIEERKKNNGEE